MLADDVGSARPSPLAPTKLLRSNGPGPGSAIRLASLEPDNVSRLGYLDRIRDVKIVATEVSSG